MSIYNIAFSPTGGTQRVADCLTDAIGNGLPINLCRPDVGKLMLTPDDLAVVSVPSFAGRVPVTAAERMQRICGNGALAVAVVAYGNRAYDDTLLELKELLIRQGFRVIAAVAAIAEHSILRQFAAGRPDDSDRAELARFGRKIKARAESGEYPESLSVPGKVPYRPLPTGGIKPVVSQSCARCGLCARECPASAIPEDAPEITNNSICISCMRCLSVCPSHARHLDEAQIEALSQRIGPALAGYKNNELFL